MIQRSSSGEPGPVPPDAGSSSSTEFRRVLYGRRTVRRYRPGAIERDVLVRLLDAARWAPSAHNRQPWRFCVVTDAALKQRLSLEMGEQWRRDRSADGADPAEIERRVATSQKRLTDAAALIVASLSMEVMDRYADARRAQAEWTMGVQSVALACENLLLAAHAEGLGACWMCAPLFAPDLVRRLLELPEAWQPQALITLGHPDGARTPERLPLDAVVVWREASG